MKQKQRGSIHIVLLSVAVVLIGGALTYALLKSTASKSNVTSVADSTSKSDESTIALDKNSASQPTEVGNGSQNQAYVEFEDWKVKFPSTIKYDLKRNSATGNETAYFITLKDLAGTCVTPDSAWLGIIRRYENPDEKITLGPSSGQTPRQLFGDTGMTVDDKLYVFGATAPSCTRGKAANPQFEQAAEKLKSEIEHLEAY